MVPTLMIDGAHRLWVLVEAQPGLRVSRVLGLDHGPVAFGDEETLPRLPVKAPT